MNSNVDDQTHCVECLNFSFSGVRIRTCHNDCINGDHELRRNEGQYK